MHEENTNWSNCESVELLSMIERYLLAKYPPGRSGNIKAIEGSLYDIPVDWRQIAVKANHTGEYAVWIEAFDQNSFNLTKKKKEINTHTHTHRCRGEIASAKVCMFF